MYKRICGYILVLHHAGSTVGAADARIKAVVRKSIDELI
jgi:hypothetical protein